MISLKSCFPDTKCVIIAECECAQPVTDFCVKRGKFVRTRQRGCNTEITVSTEFEKELRRYLQANGIQCVRKRTPIFNYRKRWGVLAGIVIFVLLLSHFSSILWSLDVNGNERLTDEDVKNLLKECGVYEGMKLKDINNDLVRIKMMTLSKDIAWISVNVKGMCAEVVVSESERPPEKEEKLQYSHIVASCDGLITAIVIERGQQMVKVGEAVKKGDLLVSGIIEERDGDVSLVSAAARVYAQTDKVIEAVQSYVIENTTVSDGKIQRISLESLGKSINFSLKYGLGAKECGIISKRGSLYVFGNFRLPVLYTLDYGIEKQVTYVTLTREQARLKAEELAYGAVFSQADAELISKRFLYDFSDDAVTVKLYAVCEENIAQALPFTAEP